MRGAIVAGLEFIVSKLKGELVEERKARKAAEAKAQADRDALNSMNAWAAATAYDDRPIRGISIEEFRRRQDEAQRKPAWAREIDFHQMYGPRMADFDGAGNE
jgi:hypothetical protein